MGDSTRNRLHTDERRAQLLELGVKLFSTWSYEEVSIDDIAREAGVSKGLLYHYFGGKRDFYVACVRVSAEHLMEVITPPDDLEPEERARVCLEAYLDFVEQRADAYAALMHGGLGADREILKLIRETRNHIVERMVEGMAAQDPSPVLRLVARSWIGSVEATSLDWLARGEPQRAVLVHYLLGTLYTSLLVAQQIDPSLEMPADSAKAAKLFQLRG
ncbi:MAG: TetR/AcrR family transcriptional regulator [Myxococcota bacterium]